MVNKQSIDVVVFSNPLSVTQVNRIKGIIKGNVLCVKE